MTVLVPGSTNPELIPQMLDHWRAGCDVVYAVREEREGESRFKLVTASWFYRLFDKLAQVELQLGPEARILGALDLEFRPLINPGQPAAPPCVLPTVPADLAQLWKPTALDAWTGDERASLLLRNARLRAHLSFREASAMSRQVATALRDQRYFASPGSLSDYEATDTPPRHIHKIFTLCILYSIGFWQLAKTFGITRDASGQDPIPDEWMARAQTTDSESADAGKAEPQGGFLTTLLDRFGEIPFFLRHALGSLSGMAEVTLRDVFWVGGQPQVLQPALVGALFVIVNHRRKKPVAYRRKPVWEQPLYLLMKREGSYFCASCGREGRMLVVHPYSQGFVRREHFRNHVDAEVVGQIVATVRSLTPTA